MRKDIFFFAGGAVLTALAVKFATESLLWDVIFYAGLVVMVGSLLDGYRRGRKRMFWADALIVTSVLGLIAGCVWRFSAPPFPGFPTSPTVVPTPTSAPEADHLQSTFGKTVYECGSIPPYDASKAAELKAQIERNAKAYGEAFGLSFVVSDIPGGIRYEISATTEGGQMRLGAMTKLWRMDIRRIGTGDRALVTSEIVTNFPEPLDAIFRMMPVDAGVENNLKKVIERMIGVPEGSCRVL